MLPNFKHTVMQEHPPVCWQPVDLSHQTLYSVIRFNSNSIRSYCLLYYFLTGNCPLQAYWYICTSNEQVPDMCIWILIRVLGVVPPKRVQKCRRVQGSHHMATWAAVNWISQEKQPFAAEYSALDQLLDHAGDRRKSRKRKQLDLSRQATSSLTM